MGSDINKIGLESSFENEIFVEEENESLEVAGSWGSLGTFGSSVGGCASSASSASSWG